PVFPRMGCRPTAAGSDQGKIFRGESGSPGSPFAFPRLESRPSPPRRRRRRHRGRTMCVIETSPVVETRRLLLRAPGAQDVSRIAALANDHDIARMTKRMPHPFGVDHAEDFVLQVASQAPKKPNTFLIEHEDHGPV